jgi:hypothetical protein
MSEENEDKNGEQEKSSDLVKRAFRKSQSMLERTICNRILQANFTRIDHVIIEHITLAVGELENQKQKIEGLNYELIKKIGKVNNSLQKVVVNKTFKTPYFSIPWRFAETKENFEKYIGPWLQKYPATFRVPNFPDITEPRKALVCSKCGTQLVNVPLEKSEEIKSIFLQKYSEHLRKKSEYQITGRKLWLNRTRFQDSLNETDKKKFLELVVKGDQRLFNYWKPPLIIETYLNCPVCQNKITIKKEFTVDSFPENAYSDRVLLNLYPRTNELWKGIEIINDKRFLESQMWRQFFASCKYLTELGFEQLKNSFEAYGVEKCLDAKGILSNWVSPNIYDDMLKLFMEREKREEKGSKDEDFLAQRS